MLWKLNGLCLSDVLVPAHGSAECNEWLRSCMIYCHCLFSDHKLEREAAEYNKVCSLWPKGALVTGITGNFPSRLSNLTGWISFNLIIEMHVKRFVFGFICWFVVCWLSTKTLDKTLTNDMVVFTDRLKHPPLTATGNTETTYNLYSCHLAFTVLL